MDKGEGLWIIFTNRLSCKKNIPAQIVIHTVDGYLLVANSGDIHSIKATTLEYLDAISVIISYDFLKEVCPDMDQIIFDVPQDHEKALEIKSAMAHLWELHKMENDEFLYLKSNETIYHVLYLLFRYFKKDRRLAASAHTETYIERFKGITEYINENKAVYGETPHKYRTKCQKS